MLLAQIYEDQCRKPRDFSPMSHSREVLVQQRDPLTFWNEDPENFWAAEKKKERRGATTLIDIQSVAAYKLWKRGGPLRQKSSRVWSIFLFRRCSCCSYAPTKQQRPEKPREEWVSLCEMTRPSQWPRRSPRGLCYCRLCQSLRIVNQISMPLLKNPLFREAVVHEVIRNSPLIQRRQLPQSASKNRR